MFIVSTKDGRRFTEGEMMENGKSLVWDALPRDIEITSLQLTFPFRIQFKDQLGNPTQAFAPKLTLSGFDEYFFHNEAIVKLTVVSNEVASSAEPNLEAKIIAGIDKSLGIVIELRMDKFGNSKAEVYPYANLQERIRKGLFRKEIIRRGFKN